ncbi:hypothetical protein AMK59_7807, partial [Oryctes borbonicus]
HYLVLELKQNLIPLYERNLFNTWAMERKIQFCKDIIDVLKIVEPGISRLQGLALFQLQSTQLQIVEPGISRLQGLALFQLQSTQLNLANKRYQCKEISAAKYLQALHEVEGNLTEAIKQLLYEPKQSPEGRLTQQAINDLKILRSTIGQMKTLCGESKLAERDDLMCQLPQKKSNAL